MHSDLVEVWGPGEFGSNVNDPLTGHWKFKVCKTIKATKIAEKK